MNKLLLPLLLCGCTAAPPQANHLMVPGSSVGDLGSGATVDEARALFGKENVRVLQLDLGEGESAGGIVVFAKDPTRRIEFLTDDSHRLTAAHIDSPGSLWHLTGGIGIGTSLATLEAVNGAPFQVYGFEWDGAGIVHSWSHGKLDEHSGTLTLRLTPHNFDDNTLKLLGDSLFSSNQAEMRLSNPKVSEIWVSLGTADPE